MAYALLIVEPPGQRQLRSEAQGRERYERMVRFSEDLKDRGLLTLSQSLASDRSGARVRVRTVQTSVVDGPFSEAKEMIGGFFLLTCELAGAGHRDRPGMSGRAAGRRSRCASSARASRNCTATCRNVRDVHSAHDRGGVAHGIGQDHRAPRTHAEPGRARRGVRAGCARERARAMAHERSARQSRSVAHDGREEPRAR